MLDKFTPEIQEEIVKQVNREVLNRFKWDFLGIEGSYRLEIAGALGEELSEALLADIDTALVHLEGKKCDLVSAATTQPIPLKSMELNLYKKSS